MGLFLNVTVMEKHIFFSFLTEASLVCVAYFPQTGLDPNEVLTTPEVVINKNKKLQLLLIQAKVNQWK